MIPEYPAFKPLEISDKNWINRQLAQTSREICELGIGNIFIWKDFDRTELTCVNGNLCMLISQPSEPPYFLEPLGRNKPVETIKTLLGHVGRVARVSRSFAALLPKNVFDLVPQRNQFDYVYLREELAALKGKKFDGKRNHIRRFAARYPGYQFVPLAPGHAQEALVLFEKWFKVREESKYFPRVAYTSQKAAVTTAFALFEKLGLLGGALIFNGTMKGFTLGSRLNEEKVSVHFLYSDPEMPGSFQAILWEACNKTFSAFKYIDLEQDLGIPGLRTAKLSYHPAELEEKFEVKLA